MIVVRHELAIRFEPALEVDHKGRRALLSHARAQWPVVLSWANTSYVSWVLPVVPLEPLRGGMLTP